MIRRRSPDLVVRPALVALGALVLIGGLVLTGALTGRSGRTDHAPAMRVAHRAGVATAASVPGGPTPTRALGPPPAVVAARFAAAFETSSWDQRPGALAARARAWSSPSLAVALEAPEGGGPPLDIVAHRSVTTATVLATTLDPEGPGAKLALVSLRLDTVTAGGASSSTRVLLPLELTRSGGHWAVSAVPGLLR